MLLEVNPRTNERTPIAGAELTQPTSVLVDCRHDDDDDDGGGRHRHNVLYVSNKGSLPAIGEVLRLVR